MEPNKLEKDFKEKLNNRTIQPSEMAWDRLDAMLSVTEKKKKPKRTWLFIAASFLGFLLIGTIFFNQSGREITTDKGVVVQEEKTGEAIQNNNEREENTQSSNQITIVKTEAIASRQPEQKREKKNPKETAVAPLKGEEAFSMVAEKKEAIAVVVPNEASKANKYIESEKLLAEAETRIQSQSVKKYVAKSSVKVDSQSLLSSVEGEMKETFRDKVIKSVGKNYEAVKVSLANRNNE